ncbi:MAG: ribonuclease Z [Rhodothermales bacterium]|jgi:ribonuclease Z
MGDGVSAALAGKAGAIRNVFVTHADRDHLGGLLQFHQLHAGKGRPKIHYPRDCGSFPALRDFLTRFDPDSGPATWQPIATGDVTDIGRGHAVHAIRSEHIAAPPEASKAFSFRVHRCKDVLRQEFRHLPGAEIATLRKERGDVAVLDRVETPVFGFSGDCPRLDPETWTGVPILMHECTFLDPNTAREQHAHLQQVLDAASTMEFRSLILMHLSTRYSHDEIRQRVRAESAKRRLPFPVYVMLPGEVYRDVLSTEPIWHAV